MGYNVYIEDLPGEESSTPKVSVECSCGWDTIALLADAVPITVRHIKDKHNTGRFHYKQFARAIDQNGKSRPVIGSRRVSAFNRRSTV